MILAAKKMISTQTSFKVSCIIAVAAIGKSLTMNELFCRHY